MSYDPTTFADQSLRVNSNYFLSARYGNYMVRAVGEPIPEPSTLALLGVAAITLLAYAWRRRKQPA
jgi:hypothetical protein